MKTLVVILNKDNADNLKRCLESLLNQSVKDFDILVLDGASKDNSKEVAEKYGVKFKVQDKLGGTGFARIEGCLYALKNGYDVVIWGDSENYYDRDYIKEILKTLKNCDVAGGIPIVEGGFFAHAFAWYHAIHLIFPNLYKVHIPGNNKAEKTWIYRVALYPKSIRAEDYGFSLLLLKKGIKLKQEVANAVVYVSLPKSFGDILKWQSARAKGVAQALKEVGFKPYDVVAWSFISLLIPILLILSFVSCIPLLAYVSILLTASIWLHIKSRKFIKNYKKIYFFAPLFGILLHSIYSIKALYEVVK